MIKKIITHDGLFHADEVMAIALIMEFYGNIPVERTRNISQEDVDDPNVWIIDVNGQYNPSKGLFDHHHDESLSASCVLILDHLYMNKTISMELMTELSDNFVVISNIDKGGFIPYNGFQFNSLIKGFNSLPDGFNVAIDVCRNYIKCAMDNVAKMGESLSIWSKGWTVNNVIKCCSAFPIHWKRYPGTIRFLVYPNNGKYNVISVDSVKHPVISNGREEFLHNSKFLAVFKTEQDALDCALKSIV
jgi:uncharacterized UPF0160 family protein